MTSRTAGFFAAALAMIAVGTAVTVSDALVGYPVFTAQAMRYAVAAIVLFLAVRMTGRNIPMPHGRDWIWLVLLAATGQALYNVAVVNGVSHAEPAAIAVLVGLVPVVFIIAEAIRLRQRPRTSMILGVALVIAGATLVQGTGHTSTLGVAWALLALACEGAHTLLAVPVLRRLGPIGVTVHSCWIAAVQLTVVSVIVDGADAVAAPSPPVFLAIGYLAVIVTALAFVLWYFAVQRLGASTAGLFAGLIPLSAAVSGMVVGLTTISPAVLGGAVLVGTGIVIALLRQAQSGHVAVSRRKARTRTWVGRHPRSADGTGPP